MTRAAISVLIGLMMVLAGCRAQTDRDATLQPTVHRRAGSWKMVHTVTAFSASNVSGGMADIVAAGEASIGKPDVGGPVCLEAAQVAGDTLSTRLEEAVRIGPEWHVTRSTVRNGKVDFSASMDDPVQGRGTLTITGSVSAIATNLVVTTDAHQPAPGKGRVQTLMRQDNARIGACMPSR